MPKVAFSTLACPKWPFDRVIANARQYGYDGVEVRQIAGETDLLQVPDLQSSCHRQLERMLKSEGVVICGLASSVRFDYPEQAERAAQLRAGQAYVELAVAVGARFVRVFGDVLPPEPQTARQTTLDHIAEGLNRLGEFAARQQVDILLETHGDFAETSVVRDLMRRIDVPAVGILWDTHHPWKFFHEPLAETWTGIGAWVRHTHWKDSVTRPAAPQPAHQTAASASAAAHSLMSGHREADYVLFGGGEFPADECARLLKQSGYDGWLSLEWEKMWHPTIEASEIALPLFASKIRALWDRV